MGTYKHHGHGGGPIRGIDRVMVKVVNAKAC